MRRFVDLHTHSVASDGQATPEQLVRLADAKRLAAVALTDHDTTAGLAEARAAAEQFPDLRFIPGIEVSARFPRGILHILGLGIDADSPALRDLVSQLRQARDERNPKIVAALQKLGCPIDMAGVLAVAREGGAAQPTVGRVHMAEALRRKGCVKTLAEAFDRLIGQNGPAYVDKERLEPAEVIAALRAAGGIAVLAHPVQLRYDNPAQLQRIVRSLIHGGLNAIEAYHSDHTAQQTRHFLDLARKLGLGVTGGSDFHGRAKPNVKLGLPRVPVSVIPRVLLMPPG